MTSKEIEQAEQEQEQIKQKVLKMLDGRIMGNTLEISRKLAREFAIKMMYRKPLDLSAEELTEYWHAIIHLYPKMVNWSITDDCPDICEEIMNNLLTESGAFCQQI